MPRRAATAASVLALLALAACERGGGREARPRLEARDQAVRPAPFDWARPAAALSLEADEAARRLGSLDFTATVTWSVTRGTGGELLRSRASERHQVRQLAGGDFQVLTEIDPGTWQGAETGREVIFAGGMTFARARYAPFRERPTDRGRDARRFRDESFRLAGDLVALLGPQLSVEPRGEATALGRPARRFALALAAKGAPAPPPSPPQLPQGGYDADTKLRVEFLEGRSPLAAEGELLLDAETGVPMAVRLSAAFGAKGDPRLRAEVELDARINAWGGLVGKVTAPRGALADDRKPRGVAKALEQAGLRKRGQAEQAQEEEPAEDGSDETQ